MPILEWGCILESWEEKIVLYHFSEKPDIRIFEPRKPANRQDERAVVWAIDVHHAPHYYVPRDCPRICVEAGEEAAESDVEKFFGLSGVRRMIAIEAGWYERIRDGKLYRYSFNPENFELMDWNAGYYVSSKTVKPIRVEPMDDLIGAMLDASIELRVMPSLMLLKKQVLSSTLRYSMIRMRNAVTGTSVES